MNDALRDAFLAFERALTDHDRFTQPRAETDEKRMRARREHTLGLLRCEVAALCTLPDTAPQGPRHIDDDVYLSNKACRNCYTPSGCDCPEGRCWYSEQCAARARGEKALQPWAWREQFAGQGGG